jgi:hypothetical protein
VGGEPLNATVTDVDVVVAVMLSETSAPPSLTGSGVVVVATMAFTEPAPELVAPMKAYPHLPHRNQRLRQRDCNTCCRVAKW